MIDRYCLLIGAMKSGTTALFQALRQHPEIAPSREKEPNFFSHDENRARGIAWYESLWDWDAQVHKWALEASTAYTKLPVRPNPALAARNFPAEFRFIYIVRDPVARIRSQYLHSLAEGWVRGPITEGVAPQALLFSNYAFQLYPYEAAFGRERIHVIRHEDFCARRTETLRSVCDFLEVDGDFTFGDTGPSNSSDQYRRKILTAILREHGIALPNSVSPEFEVPFAHFVRGCEAFVASSGYSFDFAEAAAETRRRTTPSAEQADEICGALREDLLRFCERWDIEPWPSIASAPAPIRPATDSSVPPVSFAL